MPFHAVRRTATEADFGTGSLVRVEEPLVCAVNHQTERERHGRTTVVVLRPFAYTSPDGRRTVKVPPTFLTDFASIPWWARFVIPPFGRHAIAAVLHDWLYTIGQPDRREIADDLFRDALKELGVSMIRRNAMHAAVRAGGDKPYRQAASTWADSFMDWRTGAPAVPKPGREAFFDDRWPADAPVVVLGG